MPDRDMPDRERKADDKNCVEFKAGKEPMPGRKTEQKDETEFSIEASKFFSMRFRRRGTKPNNRHDVSIVQTVCITGVVIAAIVGGVIVFVNIFGSRDGDPNTARNDPNNKGGSLTRREQKEPLVIPAPSSGTPPSSGTAGKVQPHPSRPVPDGIGQPYVPRKIGLRSCIGTTIEDPCAATSSQNTNLSTSPRGDPLGIFDPFPAILQDGFPMSRTDRRLNSAFVPPWLEFISPEMRGGSRLEYQRKFEAFNIRFGADFDQSTPISHLGGCVGNCQFARIFPIVKVSISYSFDQSSIYLTLGAYPKRQFLAVTGATDNPLPDWNAGVGIAYNVHPDLSVWVAYSHASYVAQGCGFLCSYSLQNPGRFSDESVMFGLLWRPQN